MSARRWPRVLNALLATGLLALAAWAAFDMLARPFGGMRAPGHFIVWLLGALGLNRAFAVAQARASDDRSRLRWRIAKWLAPWPLALAFVLPVEQRIQSQQSLIAARELADLVAFAQARRGDASLPDPATLPARAFPVAVRYEPAADGYRIWLTAPGLDLDGTALIHDARQARWQRTPPIEDAPRRGCTLRDLRWSCVDDEPDDAAAP